MPRRKARENRRNEAYLEVLRLDEVQRSAADGRLSTACQEKVGKR
jgi:hypothetical protein